MRVFKNQWFERFARKERIDDRALADAISRAETGLVDADLGGGLVKLRIARPGEGRSGGYRTIIVYRSAVRAVFVYGFAKKNQANLTSGELETYKEAAAIILAMGDADIQTQLYEGRWKEVVYGEDGI